MNLPFHHDHDGILANKIMVVCCVLLYWYSILSEYNHIGSVMVNVLASSVVNNGFGSWSGREHFFLPRISYILMR
jgi:hypothetical protein